MGNLLKTCVICGEDCAGRPRTKDAKGRYYHNDCYGQAKQKQEARRAAAALDAGPPLPTAVEPETMSLLGEILDDAAGGAGAGGAGGAGAGENRCHSCGHAMLPDAALCTNCGQSLHGGQIATKVGRPAKERGEGVGRVAALLRHPFVVCGAYLVIYVLLLLAVQASRSEDGAIVYDGNLTLAAVWLGWHVLLTIPVYLMVLVFAYRSGFIIGVLTTFVPFFVLYFVYLRPQTIWLRSLFTTVLLAGGLSWLA